MVTDIELGRALRAIRHRRGWTQAEVAARAGVQQSVISIAERGQIEGMSVRSLRSICAALEVRLLFTPSWRGGEIDRLLDEAHEVVTSATVRLLRRLGWQVVVELTFSRYGERGSIDVLGLRPDRRAAVVNECKTELASTEQLNRGVDRKVRLAPALIEERFGWRPTVVGRLVVFAEDSSNRRRVARASVLETSYPARGRAVADWLRDPVGPMSGLVFLSPISGRDGRQRVRTRSRVRKPKSCVGTAAAPPGIGSAAV
jgi:transcriptional regulator with XRE-family HTH domain